jgi:hypothetical protein
MDPYEPINRDRGAAFLAWTGNPDLAVVRSRFLARFGQEPEQIFEDGPYTLAGPTPDQIDEIDLYDQEDNND